MSGSALVEADDPLIEDLVVANHILYQRGVVDGFGHVSARRPHRPATFLLSRSLAPQLVRPDDIQIYELNGDEVGGDGRRGYLERFIHGAIYQARPDVMGIVHSHSPSVLPFTVVKQPLRALSHMAGFLGGGRPGLRDPRRCGRT